MVNHETARVTFGDMKHVIVPTAYLSNIFQVSKKVKSFLVPENSGSPLLIAFIKLLINRVNNIKIQDPWRYKEISSHHSSLPHPLLDTFEAIN